MDFRKKPWQIFSDSHNPQCLLRGHGFQQLSRFFPKEIQIAVA